MDKNLNLSDKILFENKKPQSKHLQTRVDYLIKVLSKEMQSVNSNKKPKNNFTNNQNTFDESNGFPNSSSRRKGKQPVINDDPPKKKYKKNNQSNISESDQDSDYSDKQVYLHFLVSFPRYTKICIFYLLFFREENLRRE